MYSIKYKINFAETDPGGILFFAEFLKIAHVAYERFFENLKLDRNYFLDDTFILPIVHTEADYLSPVRFGDELKISVIVDRIGNTSFDLKYELFNNDIVAAKIITKHVVVLKKEFKKTSIPETLKNRLKENQL